MSVKRIFYLTSSELAAVYCEHGQVKLLGRFEPNEEGVKNFAAMLAEARDYISAFVVDVIEEEFQLEKVAHVASSERAAFLKKKAFALFRTENFTNARVITREKTGRKEDTVLFSVLSREELLLPWLNAARQAKIPLAGIYSIPMLTSLLVQKLKIQNANALMLSVQNGRFLRQSLFGKGVLKLSRLTPYTVQEDSNAVLKVIQTEVDRSKRYFGRAQLLQYDAPLDVYVLSRGDDLHALRQGCVSENQVTYHFLDLDELAPKLGLKQHIAADECEWCFAYLLNRYRPVDNYINNKDLSFYKRLWVRNSMIMAGILVAIAALCWAGMDIYSGVVYSIQADEKKRATQQAREQLISEHKELPAHEHSPHVMRVTVETMQLLQKNRVEALFVPNVLASTLQAHSNIELESIKWGVAEAFSNETVAGSETEAVPDASTMGDIVKIRAYLKNTPDSYQQAFRQIENWQHSLQQHYAIAQVKLLKMPVETKAVARAEGELTSAAGMPTPKFDLEVHFKRVQHE